MWIKIISINKNQYLDQFCHKTQTNCENLTKFKFVVDYLFTTEHSN